MRSLIAVATCKKWPLFQLDVNNAFLHGDLKEEVYMKVPEGLPNPSDLICRLRKSLYGLMQASRQWHEKLATSLHTLGFVKSHHDHSLFIKKHNEEICIAAVYVDDIIVTGTNIADIEDFKAHLHHEFSIKDLGALNYFLGIEVGYTPDGILLSQGKFTKELLSACSFDLAKKATTPLPLHIKLQADDGDLLPDPETYRSLVGKLNFLTITRPDLAYVVQSLSQFWASCPDSR